MRSGWLVLLLVGAAAFGAEPGYLCTVEDPPRQVVENTEITVRVRYTVPAGRPAAPLRLELKAASGAYLQGFTQNVTGSGTATFAVALPRLSLTRQVVFVAWMGDDWQRSLAPLHSSRLVDLVTAARAAALEAMRKAAPGLQAAWRQARGDGPLVGLVRPLGDATAAEALAATLTEAGRKLIWVEPAAVVNPFALQPGLPDLLILSEPVRFPAEAMPVVAQYVDAGGKLLVAGGPAFREPYWEHRGQWLGFAAFQAALAGEVTGRVLLDFEDAAFGTWRRATNDSRTASLVRRVTPGAAGSKGALELVVPSLTGWDTFGIELTGHGIPADHTWLTFAAAAGAETPECLLELVETDGSRWMLPVDLTEQWRPYALPTQAFRYWHDSPTGTSRGQAGDRVHLERLKEFKIGLATSHNQRIGRGPHLVRIDAVGTAPEPAGAAVEWLGQSSPADLAPRLEAVSPGYKLYPVTNAARLAAVDGLDLGAAPATLPGTPLAPHPRPSGSGLDKQRRFRYVPLLTWQDDAGRRVGEAAALILNSPAAGGGMIASLPVDDSAWLAKPETVAWLNRLAGRMLDGCFLWEAGTNLFASFGQEQLTLGATVVNRGTAADELRLAVTVTGPGREVLASRTGTLTLPPGGQGSSVADWTLPATAPETMQVTVELTSGRGRLIDRVRHELLVWQPQAEADRVYLTRRDGHLFFGDQRWIAHGINYMPSTGIGLEDRDVFEYWLDPAAYDQAIVEQDLTDIAAIGFNCVSVFIYHRSLASRNLLDLMARCERKGLRVNLSLRPCTPLDFLWDQMRELVEAYRLPEHDNLIAYDLAWEPEWRNHEARRRHDPGWRDWVSARYGDLAAAEQAWGHPAPRHEGDLTNPTDDQARRPDDHGPMLLDYRLYLNGLLHEKYGEARRLMLTVDPHHLVSFRMSNAGNPTNDLASWPYDFAGLAEAVDLLQPEAYGRIGDWDRIRPGWFTTVYGRAVAPELPVVWSEYGYSVWDRLRMEPSPDKLAFVARYYDQFLQMAFDSDCDGTICWWFPGGYRWNERSDFGIINPDRSWRDVTEVLARWAPKITGPRPAPGPAEVIDVRLRDYPGGLPQLYQATEQRFWAAIEAGRRPVLKVTDLPLR